MIIHAVRSQPEHWKWANNFLEALGNALGWSLDSHQGAVTEGGEKGASTWRRQKSQPSAKAFWNLTQKTSEACRLQTWCSQNWRTQLCHLCVETLCPLHDFCYHPGTDSLTNPTLITFSYASFQRKIHTTRWMFWSKPIRTSYWGNPCTMYLNLSVPIALVRVSIVIKCHDQKENWGGKSFFGLSFSVATHRWRKSGKELKQGKIPEAEANSEATKRDCLLACFSWDAQPTFI